jgi:hypothetical protein
MTSRTRRGYCTTLFLACSFLLACKANSGGSAALPDAGPIPEGLAVGMACDNSAQCRRGLTCDNASKTCVPGGFVIQGGSCLLSAECVTGNYCTPQQVCAPSGKLPAGSACSSEGDCAGGLLCAQSGLSGLCQAPGVSDIDHSCVQTADCMAGLQCIGGVCTKGSLAVWSGVPCSAAEDPVARYYFRVPRATDPASNTDFYRLPFPNNIRLKGGLVDLTGHPRPGARLLPFDLVDRYVKAIQAEFTGFGANETIYARLSRPFNPASFPSDCGVSFVDITPTSSTYGEPVSFTCGATSASSAYICGPYIWVRPALGAPLRPGVTYAVLFRKEATDSLGSPFGADDDFRAMLDAAVPADPELAPAYAAYLPLRNYIAAGKVAAASLASAAVFTVQDYEAPMNGVAAAVAASPAPVIEGLVRCGQPGAVSPCDDLKTGAEHTRGCLAQDSSSANFDEYQGTMSLPVLQAGTPPYLEPSNGGNIVYDANGVAIVQGVQKVCFSLTVPKGIAPASGWPLVVYSHGTGGSYRSIVDLGLADDLAVGAVPGGGTILDGGVAPGATELDGGAAGLDAGALPASTRAPVAMLGYDGVLHGTRNGGSTKSVGELVYNFLNPVAARDNALQAAADLLAIPGALPQLAGAGLVIDGTRLALYGHSQGGNAASLVAARESKYGAIVMSGTGGTLIFTLLGKTRPVNIPAVLPYLLGEAGPASVDGLHPALSLMQLYFERADSVNFGRRLFHEPLTTMSPHHVLHVYGTDDSYSVVTTQRAYALSASFRVGQPVVDDFGLIPDLGGPPYHNNAFFFPYGQLTALEIQYKPDVTYDGHFVATQNPRARAAIQEMLVSYARDGVPTVTP